MEENLIYLAITLSDLLFILCLIRQDAINRHYKDIIDYQSEKIRNITSKPILSKKVKN